MTQTRTIDVTPTDGELPAQLRVHMCGTGPLAVLIHGFPLDHRMWIDVLNGELSKHRTLCAIDLRGHGASPYCGEIVHTMERFADDVACVIKKFSDGPADVCGLSMGGYVAFALHTNHRELVRSLVLTNTRAAADTDAQRAGRDAAIEMVVTKGRSAVADVMLPKLLAAGAPHRQRAQIRTMIESVPVESIVADQRGLQQRVDRRSELPNIAVPTMVLVGQQDAITPKEEAIEMAGAIPNAQLEVVENTGHMSPFEDAAAWSSAIAPLWS